MKRKVEDATNILDRVFGAKRARVYSADRQTSGTGVGGDWENAVRKAHHNVSEKIKRRKN